MTSIDAEHLAEDLIQQQVNRPFVDIDIIREALIWCALHSSGRSSRKILQSFTALYLVWQLWRSRSKICTKQSEKNIEIRSAHLAFRFRRPSLSRIVLQIFSSTIRLLDVPASARLLKTSHLVLFAASLSLTNSAPSQASTSPVPSDSRWIDILHHAGDQTDEKVHAQAGEAIRRISETLDCSSQIDR